LQVVRAKPDKLYKSLETLFSVDGRPLTDNGVFHQRPAGSPLLSAQRIFRGQSPLVASSASWAKKTIEKESIERFATLTREEREGSQSADVGF
jgi:hypothetical protein